MENVIEMFSEDDKQAINEIDEEMLVCDMRHLILDTLFATGAKTQDELWGVVKDYPFDIQPNRDRFDYLMGRLNATFSLLSVGDKFFLSERGVRLLFGECAQ